MVVGGEPGHLHSNIHSYFWLYAFKCRLINEHHLNIYQIYISVSHSFEEKNCPETAKVLSDPESFLYFSSLGIYNWYFVWSSARWKGHHRWYLFSELTRLVRTIQYLVVEHGEVQSQTQPDGVGGLHFWFTDLKSVLVSLLRVVNNS